MAVDIDLIPKITNEHIKKTPYSVVDVISVVQVLSDSVYQAFTTYGPPLFLTSAIYGTSKR